MFRCVVVCLMCLFVLFISRSLRIAGSRQKQHVCFLFGTNVIVVLVYMCVCVCCMCYLYCFCFVQLALFIVKIMKRPTTVKDQTNNRKISKWPPQAVC